MTARAATEGHPKLRPFGLQGSSTSNPCAMASEAHLTYGLNIVPTSARGKAGKSHAALLGFAAQQLYGPLPYRHAPPHKNTHTKNMTGRGAGAFLAFWSSLYFAHSCGHHCPGPHTQLQKKALGPLERAALWGGDHLMCHFSHIAQVNESASQITLDLHSLQKCVSVGCFVAETC